MPKTRQVTLHYEPNSPIGPNPRQVSVGPDDPIQFVLSPGTLAHNPGCTLRITLHNTLHFENATKIKDGLQFKPKGTLRKALAGLLALAGGNPRIVTGYKCELLDKDGVPIPSATLDGKDGGEIVPDTAGS